MLLACRFNQHMHYSIISSRAGCMTFLTRKYSKQLLLCCWLSPLLVVPCGRMNKTMH